MWEIILFVSVVVLVFGTAKKQFGRITIGTVLISVLICAIAFWPLLHWVGLGFK
jgi:hypothetical protein